MKIIKAKDDRFVDIITRTAKFRIKENGQGGGIFINKLSMDDVSEVIHIHPRFLNEIAIS